MPGRICGGGGGCEVVVVGGGGVDHERGGDMARERKQDAGCPPRHPSPALLIILKDLARQGHDKDLRLVLWPTGGAAAGGQGR